MGRFDNAGLVLGYGSAAERMAALCWFSGSPGGADCPVLLAVLADAAGFAEQLAVDDVAELMELWQVGSIYRWPVYDSVTMPELSAPVLEVVGRLQLLLERLTVEQLREVGVALAVPHDMVAMAWEFVEEAATPRVFRGGTVDGMALEERLQEERIGYQVDVAVLEAPQDWPQMLRDAVVLALVWEVAGLVAQLAQLSVLDALPVPLLWQGPHSDHECSSALVPETDRLAWTRIEQREYDGRALWALSVPQERFHWSVGWTGSEGDRLWFKSGTSASLAAARWNAEHTMQWLLEHRHEATSPQNGEALIPPG